MMSGLVSRISDERSRASWGALETAGFAIKVVGLGLCAGLGLVFCQFPIDAFFRTIR